MRWNAAWDDLLFSARDLYPKHSPLYNDFRGTNALPSLSPPHGERMNVSSCAGVWNAYAEFYKKYKQFSSKSKQSKGAEGEEQQISNPLSLPMPYDQRYR